MKLTLPKIELKFPTRVSEFRVQYQGHYQQQAPWLVARATDDGGYRLTAEYNPQIGSGYVVNGPMTVTMPRDIKLYEVRAAMVELAPAIADYLAHQADFFEFGGSCRWDAYLHASDCLRDAESLAFLCVAIRNEREYFRGR